MLAETKVQGSPAAGLADQSIMFPRGTKHGGLGRSRVAATYYEYAIRGRLFTATTAVGGVAPGQTISTTAAFTLFNAKGSGVNVVVLWGSAGYLSGTTANGFVGWYTNANLSEAVPTGTAIVASPALNGGGAPAGGVGLTTATLAVAPTLARIFFSVNTIAAASVSQGFQVLDPVDGQIVLPPGGAVSLMGVTSGAGTSPRFLYSVAFAEEPL